MNFISQLENTPFVALYFCFFMAILTLIVYIWSKVKKTTGLISFNKRMCSLWVLILLFTVAFISGKLGACIFFALLSLVALAEYKKMIAIKYNYKQQNPLIYVCLALQYIALSLISGSS